MITFDANILFYCADRRDPKKYERSVALIEAAAQGRRSFLTAQALGEFANASARKETLTRREAAQAVRDWTSLFEVKFADSEALNQALDWWADERLSYWDALLVATAAQGGAAALISEDMQDGAVFGGVEVVNPFAEDAVPRLKAQGLAM